MFNPVSFLQEQFNTASNKIKRHFSVKLSDDAAMAKKFRHIYRDMQKMEQGPLAGKPVMEAIKNPAHDFRIREMSVKEYLQSDSHANYKPDYKVINVFRPNIEILVHEAFHAHQATHGVFEFFEKPVLTLEDIIVHNLVVEAAAVAYSFVVLKELETLRSKNPEWFAGEYPTEEELAAAAIAAAQDDTSEDEVDIDLGDLPTDEELEAAAAASEADEDLDPYMWVPEGYPRFIDSPVSFEMKDVFEEAYNAVLTASGDETRALEAGGKAVVKGLLEGHSPEWRMFYASSSAYKASVYGSPESKQEPGYEDRRRDMLKKACAISPEINLTPDFLLEGDFDQTRDAIFVAVKLMRKKSPSARPSRSYGPQQHRGVRPPPPPGPAN